MNKQGTKRVKVSAGDVFEISLPDGGLAYGRVLLNIRRIAKSGKFTRPSALAGFLGNSVLISITHRRFSQRPKHLDDLRTLPAFFSELLMPDQLRKGILPIVGRLPVRPDEIDFPEWVGIYHAAPGDWHYHVNKGAITTRAAIDFEDYQWWQSLPKGSMSFGLSAEQTMMQIADSDGVQQRARLCDLRVHPERCKVLNLVGFSEEMSYDEMCDAVGGIKVAECLTLSETAVISM